MGTTSQQVLILEAVSNAEGHPNAMEIYKKVKRRLPQISLATVYRNLTKLTISGKLSRVVIGEARYEAETSRHMHFVCQNCGRIQNIVSDEIEIEARLKKKGMRMDSLIAYGVCRDCS